MFSWKVDDTCSTHSGIVISLGITIFSAVGIVSVHGNCKKDRCDSTDCVFISSINRAASYESSIVLVNFFF